MTSEPTNPARAERPPSWWIILSWVVGALVVGLMVGELVGRPAVGIGIASGLGSGVAGPLLARRWRATELTTDLGRRDRGKRQGGRVPHPVRPWGRRVG